MVRVTSVDILYYSIYTYALLCHPIEIDISYDGKDMRD